MLKKNILILKKLKSFSVLGSSISSLWVCSTFKKKIIHVYDEDVSRHGTKFSGTIIKSLNLYKGEKIILPFSKTKLNLIKKRFIKKKYDYLGLQI